MNRSVRWSVALGAGLVLSLGTLSPVTSASAGPPPAAVKAARAEARDRLDIGPSAAVEALQSVIKGKDYECGPTAFDAWINSVFAEMSPADLTFLLTHDPGLLLLIPAYDALLFGSEGDPAYALTTHARQLENTFRDVKAFWSDVKSDDIQLHAMHGDVLLDADRIARTVAFIDGVSVATAMPYAETVAAYMAAAGGFHDNPLFTLNAYAFSGDGDPDPVIAAIPDKLVFGDGVLEAMDDLGLGDVGPRVIMGHEFGHHIQYELDLFEDKVSPEATRRTELMADAFAGYYGVHARGLALNVKRVVDAVLTFFLVGDCAFRSDGHHGTPNQRRAAAEWGAEVAMNASPSSLVLPAQMFADMFDAVLPELVAPDA